MFTLFWLLTITCWLKIFNKTFNVDLAPEKFRKLDSCVDSADSCLRYENTCKVLEYIESEVAWVPKQSVSVRITDFISALVVYHYLRFAAEEYT